MNTRIGRFIRERTTSERGTGDLLVSMALALIMMAFGLLVLMPSALDLWLKVTVESDPRVTQIFEEFESAATDTIDPAPTCLDANDPACARTYSDKMRRQYKLNGIVQGEPVVKCGKLVATGPGMPPPIYAREDLTVITTADDPGLVIFEDERVACHVSYERFQVGAAGLVKTLLSDMGAVYDGRANNAFNPTVS